MDMRVCVSGARGFVGRALCAYLEANGHEVVHAVRRATLAGEIAVGEIGADTDWSFAIAYCSCTGKDENVDAVVHLAAHVHVMRDEASDSLAEYRRMNVDGTLNLARQAVAAGVRRFVFLSSIKVNGEGKEAAYRETDMPHPQDNYAISKWEAEQGLLALARETGLEVVIIRPPLVYGSGVKGNFANLVQWLRKNIPLPLGAVHNKRSFLALDNLVSFIALCADRVKSPQAANEVFLISDGEDLSTAELLRKVARAYDTRVRLIPVPVAWLRLGASLLGKRAVADRLLGSLLIDDSKARELLHWRPVVSMDEQLRKMACYDARP